MTTRVIKRARVAHAGPTRDPLVLHRRREEMARRAIAASTVMMDGSTRCTKCPPRHACNSCASLNKARVEAGLIRPKDDPRPHPNNICLQPMSGPFRGHVPIVLKNNRRPVVTAYLENKGGGWRRGLASLDGKVVYEGSWTRDKPTAWAYAIRSANDIKIGLQFEQLSLVANG